MIDTASEMMQFIEERYNSALSYNSSGRAKEDISLNVRFFIEDVHDQTASDTEDKIVYRSVECIEITTPGVRGDVVVREVMPEDKIRFRADYEAYKNLETKKALGTALESWAIATKRIVTDCNRVGIYTVEQLAVADEKLQSALGGDGRSLCEKAKIWLKAAEDCHLQSKLLNKISEKESEVSVLSGQLKEQGELIQQLQRELKAIKK